MQIYRIFLISDTFFPIVHQKYAVPLQKGLNEYAIPYR